MSLFRCLALIVFLGLVAMSTSAQSITGKVLDSVNNQPLFNISVWCEGSGYSGRQNTDRGGKFAFGQLVPGHYTVSVHTPGYEDAQQSRDLLDSRSNEYVLLLLKPDHGAKRTNAAAVDVTVPAEARSEFEKAEAALATGKKEKTAEAIRHLEKATALYPKFMEAQLRLGTAYMDLEQWDKAEQTLKHLVEIDPQAANALFALGEIYLRQKKEGEAEKVVLQGLQIEERSYEGHLALGRVYWNEAVKTKDETQSRPLLEKSYEQVKRALELNPNLAEGHLLKGNLLFKVRRPADAQHEYEEYLRLDPKGQYADQTRALVDKIKKALAESKP